MLRARCEVTALITLSRGDTFELLSIQAQRKYGIREVQRAIPNRLFKGLIFRLATFRATVHQRGEREQVIMTPYFEFGQPALDNGNQQS